MNIQKTHMIFMIIFSKEFSALVQGLVKERNTLALIHNHKIPD